MLFAGLTPLSIALLIAILAASALMSGLSGFGFSAIGALCLVGATRLAYGLSPLDAGIDLLPALFILANLRAFPSGVGALGSRRLTDTLGLVAGSIVAQATYGRLDFLDPKIFLSLLMWAVYMVMVFTRWNAGWRGRRAAYLATGAVVAAVIAWLANYYSTIHGFVQS